MSVPDHSAYRLEPFDPLHASTVVSWVNDELEQLWLTPRTVGKLTADVVLGWANGNGSAFSLVSGGDSVPRAYGELNPVRFQSDHLWLGHLIVDPCCRGTGLGTRLTELLVRRAIEQLHARRLSLVVFPDNARAIACYEKCGFRFVRNEYQRFPGMEATTRLLRYELRAR